MRDFSYIAAKTIPEAVALLRRKGESARILAVAPTSSFRFERRAEMLIG